MSGRVLRAVCTAALAAVLAASPATADPAVPGPAPVTGPAPDAGPTPDTGTGETTGTGDAPQATVSPGPGAATGSTQSVVGLLKQLQTLYQQAEEAGELYNGTAEELKKRKAEAGRLAAELARARTALDLSRRDAGRLAREQYQGRSDFSAYMRLLLSQDPRHALEQSHVIERAAVGRAATVDRLAATEKRADDLATRSRKVLDRQQVLAARQKKQRDTVRARLADVEALLASLSPGQLAELSALEQRNVDEAQEELVASGALSSTRTPTEEGGAAVRYAIGQIGKPYVWGAEGPESFDCSGLTSQAWADAGRTIPRTSQEQWRELPRVPVESLRPGDLVIYFPKATHVALYIGNGLVVQAPRPGTSVKVSPVASNPLLGAVRPDPDSEPLSTYTLPELPENASAGPDTGYAAESAPGA